MIRRMLLNCDLRLGRLFSLQTPALIREQYLQGGKGVYSRDEWAHARRSGYRGAGPNSAELDSDNRYLTRIFSSHARNLHAGLRLLETFDFSPYDSVVELGCGEMVQAFVIKTAHPRLRYRATDFDPFIVEKCSRLGLLDPIEKGVVDASQVTADQLRGFSLVISWEMIYALDEAKLGRLMRACSEAGVPFLACTTQMIGPVRYALRRLKDIDWRGGGSRYRRLIDAGELRMHGWNPSPGRYARLARSAGLALNRIWHPPSFLRGGDDFSYMLFEPIGRGRAHYQQDTST